MWAGSLHDNDQGADDIISHLNSPRVLAFLVPVTVLGALCAGVFRDRGSYIDIHLIHGKYTHTQCRVPVCFIFPIFVGKKVNVHQ